MTTKAIRAWIGFSDGKPHIDMDRDYDVPRYNLFLKKRDAEVCYEDVRKVTMTITQVENDD